MLLFHLDPGSGKRSVACLRRVGDWVCALGPLGIGFLTGTIDTKTKFDKSTDHRANFPRFTPEAIEANMPVVEMLRPLSR